MLRWVRVWSSDPIPSVDLVDQSTGAVVAGDRRSLYIYIFTILTDVGGDLSVPILTALAVFAFLGSIGCTFASATLEVILHVVESLDKATFFAYMLGEPPSE